MVLRRSATLGLVALSMAFAGCKRVEEPASDEQRAAPTTTAPPTATATTPTAPLTLTAPAQLFTLPSSAYQAALFADDEAIEVLTSSAAYRLSPDKEPLARTLDLGFAAAVTRKNYVYWSKGALWSEPRRAPSPSGPIKLGALAEQPQRIVADMGADQFAFLTHAGDNRDVIAKLEDRRPKTLYTSPGSIDALTMIGDALYFVERPGGPGFRIARLKLKGGPATFTSTKSGRWPSLLRGTKDLVYYDGARRSVLSLSPDLAQETVLAKDFICSPLAVATNVYCSTMEGIFELSATEQPRQVVPASRQLITNVAATSQRLVFITDAGGQGQDQLAVYGVPLGKPSQPAP